MDKTKTMDGWGKEKNHNIFPSGRTQSKKPKALFGTREWAAFNENCLLGCSHDCRYCYAKALAIWYKRKTPATWKNEEVRNSQLSRTFSKRSGRIMFPTTHDITPAHLIECLLFLERMLSSGNKVLIVSKPHLDCIKAICTCLERFKQNILFRFTIGSVDSSVLKFWEPNAPDFPERLASLQYAFQQGYGTSVSCEPMLDDNIDNLIRKTAPFVTDAIWLGKMNNPLYRLKLNGGTDPETTQRAKDLVALQDEKNIRELYSKYKDNPLIKWKESIKKVVGLKIPTAPGLDI